MPATISPPRREGLARTEIDGVPVFFGTEPGPLRAALIFRVGQADEELAVRGITHLVEHLALSATPFGPHAFNGAAGNLFTTFGVSGDEEVVADHLRGVCERLTELPVDGLDAERDVLRKEASRQVQRVAFRSLVVRRWGARDHGLLGWDELGVEGVTPGQVRDWAAYGFTRANGALCLSGPPPTSLRLPLGARVIDFDLPAVGRSTLGPQCYTDSDRYVALSFLTTDGPAADAWAWVVAKRLTDRLCHDLDVADRVHSATERLDAVTSLRTFVADCRPENAAIVQRETVDILAGLREEPVTKAELAGLRQVAPGPDDAFAGLLHAAQQLLLAGPDSTDRQSSRAPRVASAQEIRTVAAAAHPTMLIAVPDAAQVPATVAVQMPRSEERLSGPVHRPSAAHPDKRVTGLVRAQQGLSLLVGEDAVTVTYEQVAALLCYDDGARAVIDDSGIVVDVAPDEWEHGQAVLQDIDAAVATTRRVPAGTRVLQTFEPPHVSDTVLPGATGAPLPSVPPRVHRLVRALAVATRRVRGRRLALALGGAAAAALAVAALIFLGSAPSPPAPHAVTAPPAPPAPPSPVAVAPYHLAWQEAGFAVDFPGKPYQATSPVTTSGISLTMHAATWSSDRRTLDITAMYMPGGLAISGRAVPDAGCTSGVRAAQGTDVTVRWASAGRYPARETWYTVDGQRMVMRCFVTGRQFYTISGTPSEYRTALRSFRRLP